MHATMSLEASFLKVENTRNMLVIILKFMSTFVKNCRVHLNQANE